MAEKKVVTSTGEVISKGRHFKGQVFADPKDDVIVTYKEVSEVVKTGEGKHDFFIKKNIVAVESVNRRDYINSFSGDVGLQNVLKKIALSGKDLTSVVDSGKFYSKQGYVDISNAPTNIVEAYEAVEKGVKAFDSLPAELKKKSSMAKFAESVTPAEMKAYIDLEVSKAIAAAKATKAEERKE